MASMMRAALLHGVRDLRVGEAPKPERAPGEVLLRVRAVGVCGSDLHHYLEGSIGSAKAAEPFILGHEFAAEVVEGSELAPGTLVAVDPNRACGTCEWCAAGYPNLCPNVHFAGAPPYPTKVRWQNTSQLVPTNWCRSQKVLTQARQRS